MPSAAAPADALARNSRRDQGRPRRSIIRFRTRGPRSAERGTTVPAKLERRGIVLGTLFTTQVVADRRHVLEGLEYAARALEIALIDNPDLGTRVHDRQLSDTALCILVEHVRFDSRLLQEISDQVRVGQAGGGVELFQVRCRQSKSCILPRLARLLVLNLRRKGAKESGIHIRMTTGMWPELPLQFRPPR